MQPKQSDHTEADKHGGPLDRSRINMNEAFEVRYWARELGVSVEQIKSAVRKVGPALADVRRELTGEGL